MGWSIKIITTDPVRAEHIEAIIPKLSERVRSNAGAAALGLKIKQQWGWSLGVDVSLRDGEPNALFLGGSFSISGDIAEQAANEFTRELNATGITVAAIDKTGFLS